MFQRIPEFGINWQGIKETTSEQSPMSALNYRLLSLPLTTLIIISNGWITKQLSPPPPPPPRVRKVLQKQVIVGHFMNATHMLQSRQNGCKHFEY